MPCAASGDDSIAWQATHQFCYLVPQRTAFHSRVSRTCSPLRSATKHVMKTCQDVLSTLLRRGWRDAQPLLELRNPKPSRLHHSVASRRRVAPKAQKASTPKARSTRPCSRSAKPRASKIVNRVETATLLASFILSVRCSRKHREKRFRIVASDFFGN